MQQRPQNELKLLLTTEHFVLNQDKLRSDSTANVFTKDHDIYFHCPLANNSLVLSFLVWYFYIIYRIYSINRPMRVGAYSGMGTYSVFRQYFHPART